MEDTRSRVLLAYIAAGLFFMLVPGTFLGVWNLLQISSRESVGLVSASWLQGHGHAQIFGWIGTFILGIGCYSIPKLRAGSTPTVGAAWLCWAMWILGVSLRWVANVSEVSWRVLLPVSGLLELAAFVVFLSLVVRHRPTVADVTRAVPSATNARGALAPWVRVVMTACLGFALTLAVNAGACISVAWRGQSPVLPHDLNQRFLVLAAWGFLAPFVWGFSLNWLPVFLGLKASRPRLVFAAIAFNLAGVSLALAGHIAFATVVLTVAVLLVALGLRIFEPAARPPKTRGVHESFPFFVRLAYGWLLVAAALGMAAARWDTSGGLWGASRHAFTVGFISAMVFAIGQRVLPQFVSLRLLWSPRLMFVSLALLTAGCLLRVSSEVIAYQHYGDWAWRVLPVSAVIEMAAVSVFAVNLTTTFWLSPETGPVLQARHDHGRAECH